MAPEGVDHFDVIDPASAVWEATLRRVWDTPGA
jgi:hypothetical protein